MHGAMGGGTNGAGHVNMGLPYKAYNAEQVSAMQVMVVGVHTEMAGYEQVGMLMQGTAGAIEAAGMGPVMHLAIGGGNIIWCPLLKKIVRPSPSRWRPTARFLPRRHRPGLLMRAPAWPWRVRDLRPPSNGCSRSGQLDRASVSPTC